MNGFKIKKVQSLTLGEKLKTIRSNKRATLSDVSKNTKIQIEYLEYLEQGVYDKLPADVYVKGFLRSFAEYLNADEKDLIKSFQKERSIQRNIKGGNGKKEEVKKINLSNFYVSPKLISIVFLSVLFLGLSFYLYSKLNSFVSTPELVILNPQKDSIIYNSQVVVKGKTDDGNQVFINNQSVSVNENGEFEENLVLRNGINMITVRSVNRFDKEAVRELSIDARYEIDIPIESTNPENPENKNEQGSGNEGEPTVGEKPVEEIKDEATNSTTPPADSVTQETPVNPTENITSEN